MFSSDQRFLVSGDNRENLTETLRFALNYDNNLCHRDKPGCTRIGSFAIHPKHGLVFGNDYSGDEGDLFQVYPMPMTLEMVVEHAMQYLKSAEAGELRKMIPHDNGDGTSREGWEVYLPPFAYFRTVIAVKPSWTYYAK